ncbi:hypothetical protein Areg01_68620 [Actinoplanes regularis]|nr:hypothetical protein Areg01_68620 [Actinoplanes regularis]
MDRPEDAGDQVARVRFLLKAYEVSVDLVQVLVRLQEEFADDLAKVFHDTHLLLGFTALIDPCARQLRGLARHAV